MRDALPTRLGGLAANLARIKSVSDRTDHRDIVANLLNETKLFIEWTVSDAERKWAGESGPGRAEDLVE